MIEQIETAVRLTRDRMAAEFPQNPDILLMLDCLAAQLMAASGRPADPEEDKR